jgi:hypothetical protein
VILDLLLIGLVITLEPIPLTAFILILLSKGGTRKGAAFIFGWLLSLAIVVALTVLVTGNKPPKPNTAPSLAALAVKIAIGVALVLIAVRQPWGLVAAGVATITEAKLTSWQSYIALFLFCVVATGAYIAMEIYAGFRPEKAQALLGSIRGWIDGHKDQVIIVVSLVLGLWLVGKSIYLIVT